MDFKDLENEKDAVKQSVMVSRVLSDSLERSEKEKHRLWGMIVALLGVLAVMGAAMMLLAVNAQEIADKAMYSALTRAGQVEIQRDTNTNTTNEITQEASGDSAQINNVGGNMYADNARHTERTDE